MAVETGQFLAMLRRMLRAAAKRVGEGDEPELAQLADLRAELDMAIGHAITAQRANGRSWADIGFALGISRQAAQQRYGERT